MKNGKGRPFLEILASALNEDYRFPILEVFAFLFALSTFAQARFGLAGLGGTSVTGVRGSIGPHLHLFRIDAEEYFLRPGGTLRRE